MRLLVLGYSSIAERRILPAVAMTSAIKTVSIASRSQPEPDGWPKRGRFYRDYATALRDDQPDIVYVSLPNSMHEHWVMAALAAGKHVIVDKPAMMTRAAAERAVNQGRQAKRVVAEATVFGYHPLFEALAAFVAAHGPLTQAVAQFIIPPLPIGNFRNHGELGGGCFLDLGPYAAATMRILGGGAATEITALSGGRHPQTGVDMGFSVQARLPGGGVFSGQFSFEGEYQNRLLIVGQAGSVIMERVFTPPADYRMEWRQRIHNVENVVKFEPSDTFANFFAAVTSAIADGDREGFFDDLLDDARCREQIARALAHGSA